MPASTATHDPRLTHPTQATAAAPRPDRAWLLYLILGIVFGTVLTKAGVVSWFRMQEMFRFQSFHMYGIIGSALAVAMASLALLKRSGALAANGADTRVELLAVRELPHSGTPAELLAAAGIDAGHIAEAARALVREAAGIS